MTEIALAEMGIRQLHGYFTDAVWRKDAEAFAACFTEDGEWKIAGMHIRGREHIRKSFDTLLSTTDRAMIIPGTPILEIGDGNATGRTHFIELAKLSDGGSALRMAVYYDRYAEEDGHWRFRWRHIGLHYSGPVDLSAPLVDCPDYGPPPAIPGPNEPTFTRRA